MSNVPPPDHANAIKRLAASRRMRRLVEGQHIGEERSGHRRSVIVTLLGSFFHDPA
jgi:hypothetical protein